MTRQRVNPHQRGTPEHLLHDRWRRANADAARIGREASLLQVEADIHRGKAEHYAKALAALGHPVEPLRIEGPKPKPGSTSE